MGTVFAASALFLASPADARSIRVGLASGVSTAYVRGKALTARSGSGKKIGVPSAFTAKARGSSVIINGKSWPSPVTLSSAAPIAFGKVSYEGDLVLLARGSRLTVINRIDVEKYLRGVLGFEVNPQWGMEVLKAQAVISRTYALRQMGRHNSAGFDVCTSDHCQVYRGANVHHSSTDRAIAQTKDQVLTYGGSLAQTFFCSDAGGATADIREVWGSAVPYLVVRREPYSSPSPYAAWKADLTSAEIQNALSKKGKGVGVLKSVTISRRDAAGRATQLIFKGSSGSSTLNSAAFRTLIGSKKVRSTFFDFEPGTLRINDLPKGAGRFARRSDSAAANGAPLTAGEEAQLNALIQQKKFTVDERFEMLLHPERRRYYLSRFVKLADAPAPSEKLSPESAQVLALPSSPLLKGSSTAEVRGGRITLYGRGWGHGVGLSQWGAKAMADHGWSMEKILQFYFPGTSLQRRR